MPKRFIQVNSALPSDHASRLRRRWGHALIGSAILGGYTMFSSRLLLPLQEDGSIGWLLTPLVALGDLLLVPGMVLIHLSALRQGHHTTGGEWWAMWIANLIIYAVGLWILLALLNRPRPLLAQIADEGETDRSPRISRRAVLSGLTLGALACGTAGVTWGFVESRWFGVTRRRFPLAGLPPELDGLRLVHLTDLHLGPWTSRGQIAEVIEAANALSPDVVVLTGDYVHRSAKYIRPVVDELAKLKPRIGTVAVLGNHDWWEDPILSSEALERAGIPLIDNKRLIVTPDRHLSNRGDAGLCLAGVGDYYEDRQLYDAALGYLPASMPRILLSHNPDIAEEPGLRECGHRVDLMLCGHTHGGQVSLPGIGAPVIPSFFGNKYRQGLVRGPVCPVLVSRGIGMAGVPLRIGAPPEIILLELASGT